ncbi:MAG: 7-cyano-7-deazaguanine synthase [Planctomycetota bacterium]
MGSEPKRGLRRRWGGLRGLGYSTLARVKVLSYTAGLDKAAIVRLGTEIGAPLDLLWSCYGPGPAHCGRCESCLRLARALEAEGIRDWFEKRAQRHA